MSDFINNLLNNFKFSLIMAVSKNGVIGSNGKLPFSQSEDLKRFKLLTMGKTIVMGSKTFQSIGSKPLPNRKNVVLTSKVTTNVESNNDLLFCNLDQIFTIEPIDSTETIKSITKLFKNNLNNLNNLNNTEEVMIIGGSKVYKDFLPLATKIYLTVVDCEIEGDTFFGFDQFFTSDWKIVDKKFVPKDPKNQYDCNFYEIDKAI